MSNKFSHKIYPYDKENARVESEMQTAGAVCGHKDNDDNLNIITFDSNNNKKFHVMICKDYATTDFLNKEGNRVIKAGQPYVKESVASNYDGTYNQALSMEMFPYTIINRSTVLYNRCIRILNGDKVNLYQEKDVGDIVIDVDISCSRSLIAAIISCNLRAVHDILYYSKYKEKEISEYYNFKNNISGSFSPNIIGIVNALLERNESIKYGSTDDNRIVKYILGHNTFNNCVYLFMELLYSKSVPEIMHYNVKKIHLSANINSYNIVINCLE